jgi:hypothetical protein
MTARRRRAALLAIAVVLVGACGWMLGDRIPPTASARATVQARPPDTMAGRTPAARRARRGAIVAAAADRETAEDTAQAHCMDDRRWQLQQRRAQLGAADSPDTVIEAAMLAQRSLDPAAHTAAARELQAGSQRWPENIELAWFNAHGCESDASCEEAWRNLASLEPDNAAVWLIALAAASRRHDARAYKEALRRAGAARVYQPHHGLVFLHARAALAALPVPDSCRTPQQLASLQRELGRAPTAADWADLEAGAMEAAMGGATYGGLKACQASANPRGGDRQDCVAVLSLIATGNTLVDQQFALHMLLKLDPGAPGDGRDLRERYRQLAWLIEQTRIQRQMPAGYPAQLWMQGEVATLQARAIAEGRWPPPADWLPADAESRALIRGMH